MAGKLGKAIFSERGKILEGLIMKENSRVSPCGTGGNAAKLP
jgi:hypothetical protein